MIEKKIAYEELNLLPIWLNKKSPKKTTQTLSNIGLYFFKELNISIIVPELDNLTTDEKELFKNIFAHCGWVFIFFDNVHIELWANSKKIDSSESR